jgi:hypothetical protein
MVLVLVTQEERTRSPKASAHRQTSSTQALHRQLQAKAAERDRPREGTSRAMLVRRQIQTVGSLKCSSEILDLHETPIQQS